MEFGPKVFLLRGLAGSKHRLGNGFGLVIRVGNESPGLPLAQKTSDKLGVHGVTGSLGDHMAEQRAA